MLHPDRLLPADDKLRSIARSLYEGVKDLPIISPHGHTDPKWFADNEPFSDPVSLFITPDHYVFRMLYSQGITLDSLGIGGAPENCHDLKAIWRLFAKHYHCFQGTPSRIWLDHVFSEVFGIDERLTPGNADAFYETINTALTSDDFRPRALFDRFNIEVLATTESPLDTLASHAKIKQSEWDGRVITTFRPDPVLDPEYEGFSDNIQRLGELTQTNVDSFTGYLNALRDRRTYFREHGATATDHGHPSPRTVSLSPRECETLYKRVTQGNASPEDADLFRAHMLTEMAAMSMEDGMVMQIHPGSYRNHNELLFQRFGRDMGADIPMQTSYVAALKPLLDRFGNDSRLSIILFTLDETTYSRELAPLAGHYPSLKLGPAWWFHDSPEGMRRFRQQTTETAGFYNTVGFNDDTRAFLSIPARHDLARRIDCGHLAGLVAEHQLRESEAHDLAHALSYSLAKEAYRL
jgi:glucuronate isomerase